MADLGFTDRKQFVETWQRATSVAEVCEKLGLTRAAALSRSRKLRDLGVPLRKLDLRNRGRRCATDAELAELRDLAIRVAYEFEKAA